MAVSNCLNFGSPEDPAVMWQFSQAVRGLADGCAVVGTPVTGGNVSFYNQTGTTPILPTPVVGVLGVIDDVARRTPTAFGDTPGESIYLLGVTRDEFDGSIWAQVAHDHLGGTPPTVDLTWESTLARIMATCSKDGLITGAHDLSEGGLAQALVESALAGECGMRIVLPEGADPFVWLFSESSGRVIVSVPRGEEIRFQQMLTAQNIPHARIGVTDPDPSTFEVQGQFTLTIDELREAHEGTLPALFGVDPV